MPKPSLQRVEELFHAALALPPKDRAAYLDAACAGDLELRAAVEELLQPRRIADRRRSFLDQPGGERSRALSTRRADRADERRRSPRRVAANPWLRGARQSRPRRYGHRLQGAANTLEPHRRAQDAVAARIRDGGSIGPLPLRSRDSRAHAAPEHRADLRCRRIRRPALLRHGVCRWAEPRPIPRRQAAEPASGCPIDRNARAHDSSRPRERRDPPRSQTGQRAA